jgi:hypothetical protein
VGRHQTSQSMSTHLSGQRRNREEPVVVNVQLDISCSHEGGLGFGQRASMPQIYITRGQFFRHQKKSVTKLIGGICRSCFWHQFCLASLVDAIKMVYLFGKT